MIRSGIKSIQGRTIIDNDGNEAEVDAVVLATGYDVQQFLGNFDSACCFISATLTYVVYY